MRPNIIAIAGGIIAFISLALPWWTLTMSGSGISISFSASVSIYPYQATENVLGSSATVSIDIWYGWVALVFVVIGGVLGIVGSLARPARPILIAGGMFALVSIIVFAVGLQSHLSSPVVPGAPAAGLFSSGSYLGLYSYTSYLSFGFWLALVASIILFVSSLRKPEVATPPPPPPPPT